MNIRLSVDKRLAQSICETSDTLALKNALAYWAKLLAVGLSPVVQFDHAVWESPTAEEKFICGCHAEEKYIRQLFGESLRIVTRIHSTHPKGLDLTVSGFRKGEKQPWIEYTWNWTRETGEIGFITGSHSFPTAVSAD